MDQISLSGGRRLPAHSRARPYHRFEFNAEILTWQGSRAINCPAIRRLRRREVPYRGLVYVRSIASEGKSPAGTWRDSKAIPFSRGINSPATLTPGEPPAAPRPAPLPGGHYRGLGEGARGEGCNPPRMQG